MTDLCEAFLESWQRRVAWLNMQDAAAPGYEHPEYMQVRDSLVSSTYQHEEFLSDAELRRLILSIGYEEWAYNRTLSMVVTDIDAWYAKHDCKFL